LSELLYSLLLGSTRSRGRCWAAIRLYRHPEPSVCAVHGEFGGFDINANFDSIEGQHGRRRHIRGPQKHGIRPVRKNLFLENFLRTSCWL